MGMPLGPCSNNNAKVLRERKPGNGKPERHQVQGAPRADALTNDPTLDSNNRGITNCISIPKEQSSYAEGLIDS